jgi:hypothetical protein
MRSHIRTHIRRAVATDYSDRERVGKRDRERESGEERVRERSEGGRHKKERE